jgi:hypothetical protein
LFPRVAGSLRKWCSPHKLIQRQACRSRKYGLLLTQRRSLSRLSGPLSVGSSTRGSSHAPNETSSTKASNMEKRRNQIMAIATTNSYDVGFVGIEKDGVFSFR